MKTGMKSQGRGSVGRKALLVSSMAVVVGIGTALSVAANADVTPPPEDGDYNSTELLKACNQETDMYGHADGGCHFEPYSFEPYIEANQQVSDTVTNCSPSADSSSQVEWSQTEGETDSIEIGASAEAGISGIFSAGISTSYGHSWEYSETQGGNVMVTIPPLSKGAIYRDKPMAKVTGRMVVNFKSRKHGHFEWYVYPTLHVPDTSGKSGILTTTRPLSDAEIAQCPKGPDGTNPVAEAGAVPPEATTVVEQGVPGTPSFSTQGDTSQQFGD